MFNFQINICKNRSGIFPVFHRMMKNKILIYFILILNCLFLAKAVSTIPHKLIWNQSSEVEEHLSWELEQQFYVQ